MISGETLVSDAELAAVLGVSARRVRQLIESGTLTRIERGKLALGPAIQAMVEHASGSGSDLLRERTRKMRADAERAELELAKAKSEVAPIEEIEKVWTQTMVLIRQRVRQVPARAVMMLIGETDTIKFKKVLLTEIDQALTLAVEDIQDPNMLNDEEDAGKGQ